jgi:hypothetical protein
MAAREPRYEKRGRGDVWSIGVKDLTLDDGLANADFVLPPPSAISVLAGFHPMARPTAYRVSFPPK